MRSRRLERLCHARVICNETIAKLESRLACQRGRREEIEAEIQAIAPELRLPAPNRSPNPIFKLPPIGAAAIFSLTPMTQGEVDAHIADTRRRREAAERWKNEREASAQARLAAPDAADDPPF